MCNRQLAEAGLEGRAVPRHKFALVSDARAKPAAERVLRKLPCSVLAVKPDGFVSPVGLEVV